ncbi:hypothetical protein JOS77_29575 [Chromobacterium haemolyticum]|nr:hypothetical protein JOS77_29575 [Chromobacterium haemolyticum]
MAATQAQLEKACIEKYQTLAFLTNKSNPIWAKKQGVNGKIEGENRWKTRRTANVKTGRAPPRPPDLKSARPAAPIQLKPIVIL